MRSLLNYFNQNETIRRNKILNLISFEITHTRLNNLIEIPQLVRELSWVSNGIWPMNDNLELDKPEVQKYCLISAKNSYTDFHIDFGASSVYYHLIKVI
jgi:lysine-specific demethylase PHF8